MMGRCAKRTKSVIRRIIDELKPEGIRLISQLVEIVADLDIPSNAKRETAVAMARAALPVVKESAIRIAVETAVAALKQDGIGDLGMIDDDDVAEAREA